MIRYRYSEDFDPPAPFVHVVLQNLELTVSTAESPAQIDSGADRSVIPREIADRLSLIPVRQITVAGLGGDRRIFDTFLVRLQIRGFDSVIEMLAANEPFIILGRDLLNQFRIQLDGPNRVLEINPP